MRQRFGHVASGLVLCLATGCSPLNDPNVPEPIRQSLEPNFNTEYLLYRPSAYDRSDAWPLVVVCHGGFPDSAVRQIRDWTQLAERYGFLVAAPTIKSSCDDSASSKDDVRTPEEDARNRILAVVQHVRAGQSISNDRVFVHGSEAGGLMAMYTGLSAPDTFRAVSANDPKFDSSLFEPLEERIDPYQPVFVQVRASGVLTGKHGQQCVEWLRDQHVDVHVGSTTSDRGMDAERVVEFYESVVREIPWMRVQVASADDRSSMSLRFELTGTYKPKTYKWDFGDGDSSVVAEPVHRFAVPGAYRVTVTVNGPLRKELTRFVDVTVPRAPIESIGSEP